jgi:hypothetical protein
VLALIAALGWLLALVGFLLAAAWRSFALHWRRDAERLRATHSPEEFAEHAATLARGGKQLLFTPTPKEPPCP